MNTEWNLQIFYTGLDDPKLATDFASAQKCGEEIASYVKVARNDSEKDRAEKLLLLLENFSEIVNQLGLYLSLRNSVDSENGEVMAKQSKLMKIVSEFAEATTAADRILGELTDLDALSDESEVIKANLFYLKETKKNLAHT